MISSVNYLLTPYIIRNFFEVSRFKNPFGGNGVELFRILVLLDFPNPTLLEQFASDFDHRKISFRPVSVGTSLPSICVSVVEITEP